MREYSFERIPEERLAVIEQMVDVLKDVEGASERFLEETKDLMGRTNPPELLDSIGRECELLCNSAESLGRAIIGEILRSQCGHTILEEQVRQVTKAIGSDCRFRTDQIRAWPELVRASEKFEKHFGGTGVAGDVEQPQGRKEIRQAYLGKLKDLFSLFDRHEISVADLVRQVNAVVMDVQEDKSKRRLMQEDLVRIVDKVEKAATRRNVDLMQ